MGDDVSCAARARAALLWREQMKMRLATAALLCLTLPAFGQGVDPLIGTWKMNLEKSTSTLPLSKSMTLTISGEGQTRTLWERPRASRIRTATARNQTIYYKSLHYRELTLIGNGHRYYRARSTAMVGE
jgi:hypothetical protein